MRRTPGLRHARPNRPWPKNPPRNSFGPLYGVPISMKSSMEVAGWLCECGSALRKGYVASEDAPLVSRLRAAGAILFGNTNVPEFLMAYETDNIRCMGVPTILGTWRVHPEARAAEKSAAIRRLFRRRSRQRWWRIDSDSRTFHRHLWIEANARARSFYRPLSRVGGAIHPPWCGWAFGSNGWRCGSACSK